MTYYAVNQSEDFNYKSKLLENPKKYDIHNFDTKVSGRFDIEFPEVNFECFAKPSEYKNLFVFFSAAGRSSGKTIFHRISWCNKLNGFCLYIEDPMYKKHPGLSAGWYFGTNNISYLEYAIEIVKKVAQKQNISNENIFFVGSSSAGYAALYCSNLIKGSISYAYNPQIYLTRSPSYPNFLKNTKFDLSTFDDKFQRSNIDYISKNKQSKFIIFYNKSSPYDRKHFEDWIQKLGLVSRVGLQVYNGVHFLIQEIDNSNPHTCMGEIDDFVQALIAINLDESTKKDLIDTSLNRFKNYANHIEDKFYQDLWYNYISNEFPDFIKVDKSFLSTRKYVDFKVETLPEVFVYRTTFLRLKLSGEYVFYIRKNETTFNDKFIGEVKEICSNLDFNFKKYDKFIRINKNFKTDENMFENKIKFINNTYYTFKKLYESHTKG